ncbi:helix-turn-helix transcriptional regulator [Jannaschia sp. R86511]|uniref:helix-turn-helix transcriptional regulator n=1 Tax=Jannaschia sp. R86511 TaxID=3093853 RepID=UPI0036D2601D
MTPVPGSTPHRSSAPDGLSTDATTPAPSRTEQDPPDRTGSGPPPREPATSRWRFLTNHGHVLIHLARHPESRVRDIATAVGITERSAQSILTDLESDNYVSKVRHGRRNRYELRPELHFRHPQEADHQIGELLNIFR